MLVTVIVGLYMLAFTLSDSSTEAALLKLGTWTPLLGVLGILAVQGVCSLAIIRYFRTHEPEGFHPLKTVVAPVLGFLSMAGACYLLIKNRAALSGAGRRDEAVQALREALRLRPGWEPARTALAGLGGGDD